MAVAIQILTEPPAEAYRSTVPALRPSEYTAALIRALQLRPEWVRGKGALELGSGSGVVLAAMAELGAASLCGVDIEPAAVDAGWSLLHGLGYGEQADLRCGDLWAPVGGRRFDIIAANLPQFPMEAVPCAGRLPSWSSGGVDGRQVLDCFVEGLADHLAVGGRAIITHNAFIGVEQTRTALAWHGLSLRITATFLVSLPAEKLELITPDILRAEDGRSVHRYGPYAFAEMHMVEISDTAASD
jgi:SAM-dependent methyltransferase